MVLPFANLKIFFLAGVGEGGGRGIRCDDLQKLRRVGGQLAMRIKNIPCRIELSNTTSLHKQYEKKNFLRVVFSREKSINKQSTCSYKEVKTNQLDRIYTTNYKNLHSVFQIVTMFYYVHT